MKLKWIFDVKGGLFVLRAIPPNWHLQELNLKELLYSLLMTWILKLISLNRRFPNPSKVFLLYLHIP